MSKELTKIGSFTAGRKLVSTGSLLSTTIRLWPESNEARYRVSFKKSQSFILSETVVQEAMRNATVMDSDGSVEYPESETVANKLVSGFAGFLLGYMVTT